MRRPPVPAVTAAVVLAVVAGAAVVRDRSRDTATSPAGARRLPPLQMPGRVGEAGASAGRAALGAPDGIRAGGQYVLKGALPATPSGDVRAYRLLWQKATREQAETVARALGMTGEPKRHDAAWILTSGGRTMYVADGAGVSWSVYAGEGPVVTEPGAASSGSGSSGGAGIAVDGGIVCPDQPTPRSTKPSKPFPPSKGVPPSTTVPGPTPCGQPQPAPRRPPQPSAEKALAVARELLAALGTGRDAVLTTSDGWVGRTVMAVSPVEGRPVSGWETYVTVDVHGEIVSASGPLSAPVPAEAFPVVSAQKAFESLPEMPRILMCEQIAKEPGCAPPGDVIVTGATLGLLAVPSYDPRGDGYLLPAWIFDAQGSDVGLPVVAVPERYWSEPAPTDKPVEPPPPGSKGCAPEDRPVSSDGSAPAPPVCDPGATGGSEPGAGGGADPGAGGGAEPAPDGAPGSVGPTK